MKKGVPISPGVAVARDGTATVVVPPSVVSRPWNSSPTDEETVTALNRGVDALTRAVGGQAGAGASAAKRLGAALTQLANGDRAVRALRERLQRLLP